MENKSESGVASLKQPLVLKLCELAMKQNKIITLLSMIVIKLVKSVSKQPFLQLNCLGLARTIADVPAF